MSIMVRQEDTEAVNAFVFMVWRREARQWHFEARKQEGRKPATTSGHKACQPARDLELSSAAVILFVETVSHPRRLEARGLACLLKRHVHVRCVSRQHSTTSATTTPDFANRGLRATESRKKKKLRNGSQRFRVSRRKLARVGQVL